MRKPEGIPSRQKAAIMLMVLGPELSANIIQHFEDEELEALTLEVARLERVSPELREQAILEFRDLAMAQDFIAEGGIEKARNVLEKAFGPARAEEMVKKIVVAMQVVPFEFLKKADPSQVLSFIQDEH